MATKPKQARGEAVVRKVLEGGLEVFLRDGYEGTSVDRIAAETRTSKATIYRFFEDKDALFEAVAKHALKRGRAPIEFARSAGGEVAQSLYDLASQMVDRVTSKKQLELMRVYIFEIRRFPAIEKIFSNSDKEDERWLVEIFEELSSMGVLEIDDPQQAAEVFVDLTVNPFLVVELFRPRRLRVAQERQERLERAIGQFLTLYPPIR